MHIFRQRAAFPGGIRLPVSERVAADSLVRQMPFAPLLQLPLKQQAEAAAVPAVRAGEEVLRGQLLARAEDDRAVPLHAPATGRIVRITRQSDGQGGTEAVIELAPLPGDTQEQSPGQSFGPEHHSADELLDAIRQAGLVGLGGEGEATHLRLERARQRAVEVLVINGIEGEPGFARVPALLARHGPDLLRGARIIGKVLGARQSVLVVEQADAAAARSMLVEFDDRTVPALEVLPPRYPQGAQVLLLRSLAMRGIQGSPAFSADQAMVFSLATVAEVGRLLTSGLSLTDQLITLAGDGLREPGNYRVPLGTPVGFALAQAGARADLNRVLSGGPMRGRALGSLDRPILKGATGLVAMAAQPDAGSSEPQACIRCGECVTACPLQLHPAELGLLARQGEVEAMVSDWHLERCFECGCCAYVCPAQIPLVQMFQSAKQQWRRTRALAAAEPSA